MANYRIIRSDELYHFGVPGMRWGVHRNATRYYAAKAKKLTKLDKKIRRLKVKSAKYNYKSAKAELSSDSEKAQRKSVKYKEKSNKAARRAEKSVKKGIKVYNKMMKKLANTDISQIRESDIMVARSFAAKYLNDRED